jgi:hypothetical protein
LGYEFNTWFWMDSPNANINKMLFLDLLLQLLAFWVLSRRGLNTNNRVPRRQPPPSVHQIPAPSSSRRLHRWCGFSA